MNRIVLALLALAGAVLAAPVSAQFLSPVVPVVSGAAGSNIVLKTGSGQLNALSAQIGATGGYVMIFDATSAPADGAVTPKYCWQVPANGGMALSWPTPAIFSAGIVVVFSTTGCFTKTASSTAFFSGQVQ